MKPSKKILTVVQARTGSSRLPSKVMMPVLGKPLLYRQLERMLHATLAGEIVVATTEDKSDKIIVDFCAEEGFNCFAGHPTDLLDRHYQAAKKYKADVVLKIPSDCPLIDPAVIDKTIRYFIENEGYDYVSNLHLGTYPDGNDVEIMTFGALENAWLNAGDPEEREHTTPYILHHPEHFNIGNVTWEKGLNYSEIHRWTIDYIEDYRFIKKVYEMLYPVNPLFGLDDILDLVTTYPEIYNLNSQYAGQYWWNKKTDQTSILERQ